MSTLRRRDSVAGRGCVRGAPHVAAEAPGLVLLMERYIAIVRQTTGAEVPAAGEDLHQISARIAAGGLEDGAAWIEQLRTALNVFAR